MNIDPKVYDKLNKGELKDEECYLMDVVKTYTNSQIDFKDIQTQIIMNNKYQIFTGIALEALQEIEYLYLKIGNRNKCLKDISFGLVKMIQSWNWEELKTLANSTVNTPKFAEFAYIDTIFSHFIHDGIKYKLNANATNSDIELMMGEITTANPIKSDLDLIKNKTKIRLKNGFVNAFAKTYETKINRDVIDVDFILYNNDKDNFITSKILNIRKKTTTVDSIKTTTTTVELPDVYIDNEIIFNTIMIKDEKYISTDYSYDEDTGRLILNFSETLDNLTEDDNVTLVRLDYIRQDDKPIIYAPYNTLFSSSTCDLTTSTLDKPVYNNTSTAMSYVNGINYNVLQLAEHFINEKGANGNCIFALYNGVYEKSGSRLKIGKDSIMLYEITMDGNKPIISMYDNDLKPEYIKCGLTHTTVKTFLSEKFNLMCDTSNLFDIHIMDKSNDTFELKSLNVTVDTETDGDNNSVNYLEITPYTNEFSLITENIPNIFNSNTSNRSHLDMMLYTVKDIYASTSAGDYDIELYNNPESFQTDSIILLNEMIKYDGSNNRNYAHKAGIKKYLSNYGEFVNSNIKFTDYTIRGELTNDDVKLFINILPNLKTQFVNYNIERQCSFTKTYDHSDYKYIKYDNPPEGIDDDYHQISQDFNTISKSEGIISSMDVFDRSFRFTYKSKLRNIGYVNDKVTYITDDNGELVDVYYSSDDNDSFYLFKNFEDITMNKYNISGSSILTENMIMSDMKEDNGELLLYSNINSNFINHKQGYQLSKDIGKSSHHNNLSLNSCRVNYEYYMYSILKSGMTKIEAGYDINQLALFKNESIDIEYKSLINHFFNNGDVFYYKNSDSFKINNTVMNNDDSCFMVKRRFNRNLHSKSKLVNDLDIAIGEDGNIVKINNDLINIITYTYGNLVTYITDDKLYKLDNILNESPESIMVKLEDKKYSVNRYTGNNTSLFMNNVLTVDRISDIYSFYIDVEQILSKASPYYNNIVVPCYKDGNNWYVDSINAIDSTIVGYVYGNNKVEYIGGISYNDSTKIATFTPNAEHADFVKGVVFKRLIVERYFELDVSNIEIVDKNITFKINNIVTKGDNNDNIFEPKADEKGELEKLDSFIDNIRVTILQEFINDAETYTAIGDDKKKVNFGIIDSKTLYIAPISASKHSIPLYIFTPMEIYNASAFDNYLKSGNKYAICNDMIGIELDKDSYYKITDSNSGFNKTDSNLNNILWNFNDRIYEHVGKSGDDISMSMDNITGHTNNLLERLPHTSYINNKTFLCDLTYRSVDHINDNYYLCIPNFYNYYFNDKLLELNSKEHFEISFFKGTSQDYIDITNIIKDDTKYDREYLLYSVENNPILKPNHLYAVVNSNTDVDANPLPAFNETQIINFHDAYNYFRHIIKIENGIDPNDGLKYEQMIKEYMIGTDDFYSTPAVPYGAYYNIVVSYNLAIQTNVKYDPDTTLLYKIGDQKHLIYTIDNDKMVNITDKLNINNYNTIKDTGLK